MAGYIGPIPVPQATQTRETFTATASQTTFNTGGYTSGFIDVFMNGVKLASADFTATNGSDVVLATGAAVGDIIEVVAYTAFEVLNQNFTGNTSTQDLTVSGNLTVTGTTVTIDTATAQNVDLGDNDKIRMGDGDDLQIYHDGTHSHIDNNTGDLTLDVVGDIILDADGGDLIFADGGAYKAFISNSSDDVVFTNASTDKDIVFKGYDGSSLIEAMRIDMSDSGSAYFNSKVGIGTSSPSALLNLSFNQSAAYSSTGEPREDMIIHNINGADGTGVNNHATLGFHVASGATSQGFLSYIRTADNTGAFTFSQRTGGSSYAEAMRIDSSGNLLIGKSAAGFANVGTELAQSGFAFFTRDGGGPLQLNRKTSDGDIIELYKDGTEVGSIGTNGGRLHIGSTEGDDCFIGFGNSIVRPTNSAGSSRDANTDLGYTGMRFRDLYLSGGVYLGGTGAANKLEDYEEGTWTPSLHYTSNGATQPSVNPSNFTYIKVGALVFVTGYMSVSSAGSGTSTRLSGLPFSGNANYQMSPFWSANGSNVIGGYISGGTSFIQLGLLTSGSGSLSSSSLPSEIAIQHVYRTA